MIQRRAFLAGLGSMLAASAIVHAGNLMPVRALRQCSPFRLCADYDGAILVINIAYGHCFMRPEWVIENYKPVTRGLFISQT